MSPCCLAAAAATAVLTALVVVALTAFVLVTDGFGLGLLAGTLLAMGLQHAGWIGPCPRLLHAYSALLALRAVWLLATSRRPLVLAVVRRVTARAASALRRTPLGRLRRADLRHPACPAHAHGLRSPAPTDRGDR